MFDCRKALRFACAAVAVFCCQGVARAQTPLLVEEPPAADQVLEITPSLMPHPNDGSYVLSDPVNRKSNAYPKGDFASQVSAASGDCCGACDWGWGCGGSPYRTGPGKCDNWRVGPVWKVELDGLIFFHEDTDIDGIVARSNELQIPPSAAVPDYTENFGEAPGVRISATSFWPQCAGYEINMTYTGIPEYNASAVFPATANPFEDVGDQRYVTYTTAMHSLELNFLPFVDSPWKRSFGIRYFLVDENIDDFTDQFGPPPVAPMEQLELRDVLRSTVVENHLIGFQGGIRRDVWRARPWLFVEGFANAGVYCNVIKREDILQESAFFQEVIQVDDPMTPEDELVIDTVTNSFRSVVKTERTLMALAGEVEIALVCKLNRCLALRSGYQAIVIDGVELADDAFINFDSNPERETRFYHGFFGGLEYRR